MSRNLCLCFRLFYIFLYLLWSFCKQQSHPVQISSELSPTAGCGCTSGDEMQQHLASTSHPLSHSYDIGNVHGCTLFLTAPIMPTISWVRRLNQEKEKRGIKTADLGIHTLSILLYLPQNDILGDLHNILLLAIFKNIYFVQLFFTQWCC